MRSWTRVCRETGKVESLSEEEVRYRLCHFFDDPQLLMDCATREVPVSSPYAEYYPDRPLEDDE